MKMPRHMVLVPALALLGCAVVQAAQPAVAAQPAATARLQELEDREAIRLVLRDYGRLLDERKFDEFGQLFAEEGEYVSGNTTKGPVAIADSLRRIMGSNSLGLAEPNFHVLFNERIELHGDTADSTSQSFFVAPGPDGAPQLIMMGSYVDSLVRTAQGWKFAKRVVRGNMSLRATPKPK
jgi:hypothetical protein